MADYLVSDNPVEEMNVLRSLLEVGARLYACRDQEAMLETILGEARHLTRAEAGSLYLAQDGRLKFVAVQNDRLNAPEIIDHLLGKEIPISDQSLAGFVASTGRIINIRDSHILPPGAPFRINRDFDIKTGYRVCSVLAIPLNCPDGECVGVLELFNGIGPDGRRGPFPTSVGSAVISLASTAAITVHNIRLQEQLRRVHLTTIFRLSMVAEYRDADTSEHIQRVSRTSELLAEALGLSADQTELIKYASPMHDVGKVGIPDVILLKAGYLTSSQRNIMQKHTEVGAEIFHDPADDVTAMARDVALSHHERWDGDGYPRAMNSEDIPLAGRIVGVADVFDAVVSRRCYKGAQSLDMALDILEKDTGHHFDPDVVAAFMGSLDSVLEGYPQLRTEQ